MKQNKIPDRKTIKWKEYLFSRVLDFCPSLKECTKCGRVMLWGSTYPCECTEDEITKTRTVNLKKELNGKKLFKLMESK